jgi:predicted acyl esterase
VRLGGSAAVVHRPGRHRGGSYLAYDQWQLAAAGCPGLVTIMPSFSPLALYRDVHPGGAFEATRIAWAVMMAGRTRQMFKRWCTQAPGGGSRRLDKQDSC